MILLDNYNVTNVEFVTTGQNILACESFEEEHYDIYSIKTVFGDILKESISTHGNSPIIELNVNYKGKIHTNVPFIVSPVAKHTCININTLTGKYTIPQPVIVEQTAVALMEVDEFVPLPVFEKIDTVHQQLLKQKTATINVLQEENEQQLKYTKQIVSDVIQAGLDKINKTIESYKTTVISEINTAKNNNLEANYGEFLADTELAKAKLVNYINQTVIDKQPLLNNYTNTLTLDIKNSLQKYVTEVFSENLQVSENSLNEIKSEALNKIQATVSVLTEEVKVNLDEILISAQDKFNKNVSLLDQKVDSKLNKFQETITNSITDNLTEKVNQIVSDFNNTLLENFNQLELDINAKNTDSHKLLEFVNQTVTDIKITLPYQINSQIVEIVEEEYAKLTQPLLLDTVDTLRSELVTLIKEETSQSALFEQTKNVTIEKVTQIFTEAKGNSKSFEKTLKAYKDDVLKEIKDISQQYSAKVLRRIEMSAGGGSIAQQFANGGTMNGNLNVTGKILSGGVDIYTLFVTGSGSGGDNIAVNTIVQTSSANWNNTYTTVNSNSAAWSLSVNNNSPGYYGSFYDTSTQTLTGVNQAKRLDIANTFEANGISLSGNKIVFNNIGTYELIFSIQYKNISQNQEDIYIWYRKNGVDIPYSSSVFTIPARKSAGIPAHLIAVTPFIATLAASDFIEIYWHCNNTEVTVETFTTHNNPTIPDTPGVIITATQVAVLSSFGNVTGPVSAVNNSIARFNGTTGKVIADGANSTIDDNGNAVFAGTLSANGAITTTQYVNISSTTFTGLTATATTSLTALNTFLQVIVNGSTKYLRLFDII